jgi:signal transduction histidine kinase
MAVLRLYDGERFRRAAQRGFTPELAQWILTESDKYAEHPEGLSRQMVAAKRPIHILDYRETVSYRSGHPSVVAAVELGGVRTSLGVPMQKEGRLLGAIVVSRPEVRAFTQKQIDLVSTFAAQAVIAIENVRLFKELAARNAEITASLEQQTATAEILRAISGSPTDVTPVLEAVTHRAAQLCEARDARLFLVDGDTLSNVCGFGELKGVITTIPLSRGTPLSRAVLDQAVQHIEDITTRFDEFPDVRELSQPFRVRTILAVPLVREGKAFGGILIRRMDVRPFTEKQIELVKTFADQAVIAIENVRLFKELEARTDSLARSVGQLTALSEVGQAISSTLDLETVLKTIVARAVELSRQDAGVIYEYDPATEGFELRAAQNFDEQTIAGMRGAAIRKGVGVVGISAVTHEPTQVPDTHVADYPARLREILDEAGFRAVLAVPMLREDQIIGALTVIRKTPGPFSAEVVQLLETFASQSALAIQNARLFREIADKGRQLEVASRHKSDFLASMSHELRTPLNAILGFIELILDQIYGEVPADLQEPLADIQASGKHLLRLINNVLDLAKIEAGRMELALTEYSVQDTVESVRQTLRPLAADKGLELLATVPADLPFAHGDPGRITQCLMNLAGNSLKFTKKGKVEISVDRQGSRLVFRVADTGIGIAPDKIGSLFTEFKQTDATIASEYGGTGLGLAITRQFIEMHGGRIWVESEPGMGSTFMFEIPLRAQPT